MNHAAHYRLISAEKIEETGSKFWEENSESFFRKVQSSSEAGYSRLDTISEYLFPDIKIREVDDPRAVYFKTKAEELGFFIKLDHNPSSDRGIFIYVSWI